MLKKSCNESYTTMTQMVMPNDTNPLGNLMGGNLLRWMDIACAICAGRHAGTLAITVSVDTVSFEHPVRIGDIVTLEAFVTRTFNTSMEIMIEAFKENPQSKQERIKTNSAFFTFIGINEEGKPIPVPQVVPQTEEQRKLHKGAARRRELRLLFARRITPDQARELKSLFLPDVLDGK